MRMIYNTVLDVVQLIYVATMALPMLRTTRTTDLKPYEAVYCSKLHIWKVMPRIADGLSRSSDLNPAVNDSYRVLVRE